MAVLLLPATARVLSSATRTPRENRVRPRPAARVEALFVGRTGFCSGRGERRMAVRRPGTRWAAEPVWKPALRRATDYRQTPVVGSLAWPIAGGLGTMPSSTGSS